MLLGCKGQVGSAFARLATPHWEVVPLDRDQCDLYKLEPLRALIRDERPSIIVNAAGYTTVERAEREEEEDLAKQANGIAPGVIAEEARRLDAYFVHYSTDYVFDGKKRTPYLETDATGPLQAYGRTKLEGEDGIRASGCRHVILRSSWVYAHRGRNFVLAILDRARKEGRLRVVSDQTGTPTWAEDLARLTVDLLRLPKPPQGTFHAASAGHATWHEFAREVIRLAGLTIPVEAVTTAEFPSAIERPVYSVLDSRKLARTTGIPAIGDWRERLSAFNDFEALRNLGGLAEHDRR
ncbi:MAG TPA: dTDP-4-dehydrorhamnose reductase [Burkholderiales bacterium]